MHKCIVFVLALSFFSLMHCHGEVIFREEFGSQESLQHWNRWISLADAGTIEFSPNQGIESSGAVRFVHPGRMTFHRNFAFKPTGGGLYRASFQLRSDGTNAGAGKVGIQFYPVIQALGMPTYFMVESSLVTPTAEWQEVSVDFLAPEDGKIGGYPILGGRILAMLQNINTTIYIDNFKVESVTERRSRWNENFTQPDSLNKWGVYSEGTTEGVYELSRLEKGYADSGALALAYKSGVPGYASIN